MTPDPDRPGWFQCTKEELLEFVRSYPKPLRRGVITIGDPAKCIYYDPDEGISPPRASYSFECFEPEHGYAVRPLA